MQFHTRCLSLPYLQAHNALLTNDGDVRFGYLGLHKVDKNGSAAPSSGHNSEVTTEPASDVHSVAMVLFRMATGNENLCSVDELSATIRNPLRHELLSRSLFAASKPSADELTQIITELSPCDTRQFSKQTRVLVEVEKRAKAAAEDELRRTAKLRAPTPCVMICDPGSGGVECECALVLLRGLRDAGYIQPLGVVANLWPSGDRARLLRGTLDLLGMHHVPVGIGSNGGSSDHTENLWTNAQTYITPPNSEREGTITTGRQLLKRVFEEAAPSSITLLCTSSLIDAAMFLRDSGKMKSK